MSRGWGVERWLFFFIYFSASTSRYKSEHFELTKAYIHNDGVVHWTPGGQSDTTCPIDTFLYPFDTQKCPLTFANWVYSAKQVNLSYWPETKDVLLESYQENGEWDVTDVTFRRRGIIYKCCPDEEFPEVTYTLHLKRKTLYYIMNLIVPLVTLSFLTLIVFHIPSEDGEKLSVGITILLSYFVFMLMISESLPSTSTNIPLIRKYQSRVSWVFLNNSIPFKGQDLVMSYLYWHQHGSLNNLYSEKDTNVSR